MEQVAALESILTDLLVPNNEIITKCTSALGIWIKQQNFLEELFKVLVTSSNPQVRQYAAVILRRRLVRWSYWKTLDRKNVPSIRRQLLQTLENETEKPVRNVLCDIVAGIFKLEITHERTWKDLIEFIKTNVMHAEIKRREMGSQLLASVTLLTGEMLESSAAAMLQIVGVLFTEEPNSVNCAVQLNAVKILANLASCISTREHANIAQTLVTPVLRFVRVQAQPNTEAASEALGTLEELVACETPGLLSPAHVRELVDTCLALAANRQLDASLRSRSLTVLVELIQNRKKSILKLRLVDGLLAAALRLVCEPPEDEDEADWATENENEAEHEPVHVVACQVIDALALNVSPDAVVPSVMQFVERSVVSTNAYDRKACYHVLGVIVEGCSEYIIEHCFEPVIECLCNGVNDPSLMVLSTVMFAISESAQYLSSRISAHTERILPLLFQYVERFLAFCIDPQSAGGANVPLAHVREALRKTFYALDTLCENMEKRHADRLGELVPRLLAIGESPQVSMRVKALALSTVSSIAESAKTAVVPHFARAMHMLMNCLNEGTRREAELAAATQPSTETNEDNNREGAHLLRLQALETFSTLAREMKPALFKPFATDCLQLALSLLKMDVVEDTVPADASGNQTVVRTMNISKQADPEVTRYAFLLLGALAKVFGDELTPALPTVMQAALSVIQSTDEVQPRRAEQGGLSADILKLFDSLGDDENRNGHGQARKNNDESDEDEDDDDPNVIGYAVENDYLELKAQTVVTVGEFAENLGLRFVPFLITNQPDQAQLPKDNAAYSEVTETLIALLEYPNSTLKKAVCYALSEIAYVFALTVVTQTNTQDEASSPVFSVLVNLLAKLVHSLQDDVRDDPDAEFAFECADQLRELFERFNQAEKSAADPQVVLANKDRMARFCLAHIDSTLKLVDNIMRNQCKSQSDAADESDARGGSGRKRAHSDAEEDDAEDESEYERMLVERAGELVASTIRTIRHSAPRESGAALAEVASGVPTQCTAEAEGRIQSIVRDTLSAVLRRFGIVSEPTRESSASNRRRRAKPKYVTNARAARQSEFERLLATSSNEVLRRVGELSAAERAYLTGTIADVCEASGTAISPFAGELCTLLAELATTDYDPDVRSNAMFGLSVLVCNWCFVQREQALAHAERALVALRDLLNKELGGATVENEHLADNLVAAFCRFLALDFTRFVPACFDDSVMIGLGDTQVRFANFFFERCLPLRSDVSEHYTVYAFTFRLAQFAPQLVSTHLAALLRGICFCLANDDFDKKVELVVRGMLSSLLVQNALAFQQIASTLNESEQSLLDTFMRDTKA